MFNAAGPSLPRPREEVPCLGAGGAPCLLPARLMPGLPRPVLAGRGVFLQRHGRPSSRERLLYSATVMAIAAGYIEKMPRVFMPAASSNGSPKGCYRRGPKA